MRSRGGVCALGRKGPNVNLVEYRAGERGPGPAGISPLVLASVDNLRWTVRTSRLEARCRIRKVAALIEAKLVERSRSRARHHPREVTCPASSSVVEIVASSMLLSTNETVVRRGAHTLAWMEPSGATSAPMGERRHPGTWGATVACGLTMTVINPGRIDTRFSRDSALVGHVVASRK